MIVTSASELNGMGYPIVLVPARHPRPPHPLRIALRATAELLAYGSPFHHPDCSRWVPIRIFVIPQGFNFGSRLFGGVARSAHLGSSPPAGLTVRAPIPRTSGWKPRRADRRSPRPYRLRLFSEISSSIRTMRGRCMLFIFICRNLLG